jgi:hypothetical protein
MKKLTVEQVIARLRREIDKMEAKKDREGLDLLVTDAEEIDYKVEAYEDVLKLLARVK